MLRLLPEIGLIVVGLPLLLVACGGSDPVDQTPAEKPLSTLLITLDTTRADALSCYGRTTFVTPHLDRLRREGILYEAAHTVAPLTLVAHASMLTGLYPVRHGVRYNGPFPLTGTATTLAELAGDAGIDTAAFIAAPVMSTDFGLDQGFDLYDAPAVSGDWDDRVTGMREAEEIVDRALEWFAKRDAERPFFAWVHLFDPHRPLQTRMEYDGRILRNADYPDGRYLAEVAYMDDQIGRLLMHLDEAGLTDSTLILAVGDHGESLEEHGEITHGVYCYEGTIRVPLLVHHPDGWRAGERSRETVSVVDVLPTLAEALGLPLPDGIDGVSLFRHTVGDERGVYFEGFSSFLNYGWSQTAGWIDARGKYLHSSEPEYYDLAADPTESNNLVTERAEDVTRSRNAIDALAQLPALEMADRADLDQELMSALADLGYAGVGFSADDIPHPLAVGDRPSPASRVQEYRDVMDGMSHFANRRFDPAVELFRKIIGTNPGNMVALDHLCACLLEQKQHEEVIPHLQRLIEERGGRPGDYFNLGVSLRLTGRFAEAIPFLAYAVELMPEETSFLRELGICYEAEGRIEDAQRMKDEIDRINAEK